MDLILRDLKVRYSIAGWKEREIIAYGASGLLRPAIINDMISGESPLSARDIAVSVN